MRYYSDDYFPHASTYVKYLQDFAEGLGLNIKYNTEILSIARQNSYRAGLTFSLTDQYGLSYQCSILIVSTGMSLPVIPDGLQGIHYAEGYESISVDPRSFEGKVVLILGKGNSAFETASNMVGSASYIHMISRSRLRLACQTHYVGDVRAINSELIDSYQLKSLDGLFESELGLEDQAIIKKGRRLYLVLSNAYDEAKRKYPDKLPDDNAFGTFGSAYDRIIRCFGFKFDFSVFTDSASPTVGMDDKYPDLLPNYESSTVPHMYFAGAATHSLDHRKSAGGFIHGFRYTARALYRHLQWRYHGVRWPSISLSPVDLTNHFVKRMNEASGVFQMFDVLVDVAVIRNDNVIDYLEEVPFASLHMIKEMTGHDSKQLITLSMQYGQNYSGAGKDVFSEGRASANVRTADLSNFLHPVFHYYEEFGNSKYLFPKEEINKADLYHHVLEDFQTDWTARHSHIIPLRRYVEAIYDADLRYYSAEMCFKLLLTYGTNIPLSCTQIM